MWEKGKLSKAHTAGRDYELLLSRYLNELQGEPRPGEGTHVYLEINFIKVLASTA